MQRIHNLSKWVYVETSMVFDNPEPRLVKVEVNCPDATQFFVTRDSFDVENDPERQTDRAAHRDITPRADTVFLGLAEGRDGFEFWVEGPFRLEPSEPCWIFTVDSIRIANKVIAPLVFTRIANRRARNPHLEMMEFQMKRNTEARLQAMAREMERRIKATEDGLERFKAERQPRAPAALVGRKEPEQDRREPEPAQPAGTGGAHEDQGEKGGKPAKSGKAPVAGDDGGKAGKAK